MITFKFKVQYYCYNNKCPWTPSLDHVKATENPTRLGNYHKQAATKKNPLKFPILIHYMFCTIIG